MNSNIKDLEKTLWAAADKMRGGVSVTNYKFLILGLIFLKYISDSFDERYNTLKKKDWVLRKTAMPTSRKTYSLCQKMHAGNIS